MFKLIRQFLIKNITPIVWRLSPNRKIQALQEFSLIEKDSGNQLFHCINLIKDPQIKAELFQHVLEEFCHADLFESLVREYSAHYLNVSIIPREYFLKSNADIEKIVEFYSYAHVGESDVSKDFLIYGRSAFDNKIKKTFARIGADENRHEVGTGDILLKLCANKKSVYFKYIFKSHLKRKWKQLEAQLKSLGQFQLTLILSMIYFILGPFIYKNLKKGLDGSSNSQLNILKSQIIEISRSFK